MSERGSGSIQAPHPVITRYAVAFLAVLAAVVVRLVLSPFLQSHAPLLLFTLAVMLAAHFGGVGPGIFATCLSAITGDYLFIAPHDSFVIASPADTVYLALFLVVGIGISFLNERLRGAVQASTRAAEQYRVLSEAVPQLVWTCGLDGACDYVNVRWTEYTGAPPARLLAAGWLDAVHPDDRLAVQSHWQKATAEKQNFDTEIRLRNVNGEYRWFKVRALVLRDDAGTVLKWFVSGTDQHDTRQAREALRIEQERLSRIAATAPGVICSFQLRPDGSACFPYASPAIRDLYGVDPAELREDAAPVFRAMHPDDVERVRATIAESARTMAPWRDQFRVRNPARGEIWVEGHSQPLPQPGGGIEWYGFVSDVTDRCRMDQSLREHDHLLEELTRALDLAHVIVRTPEGIVTYWSGGAAAMYGWSAEEAVGRSSHELLRTEFPAGYQQIYSELVSTSRWEGELRHYRRDGSAVDVASHWALHRDEGGNPASVTEVNNEISLRKRVEAELRASEQRLELAQAAAGIGSWDWDLATDETRCSDSYGPLYGLPEGHQAPSSEDWLRMLHPDDRERLREELRRALTGEHPYDTEFRVITPAGQVRWLSGKGEVYRDASGKAVRMLGVNMDITERKAAAEQLRALSASLISAQEEERRRISRELHDDLTQRLGLMAIDLGKLASQDPGPAMPEQIRFLQERAAEAAELTRHIAHELHPSILDDFGIETALRSYCQEFSDREGIEVEFTGSGAAPQEITREAASCLYAVAQEALLNVAKHARATRVCVDVSASSGMLRVSISDNGIGMAPGGTLFGLGIVNMRERVRQVNGRFSSDSKPGCGTVVTAVLPVREKAEV